MINPHKRMLPTSAGIGPATPGLQSVGASCREMEWGRAFFMNRANTEGACLYNKWWTSTLNPFRQKLVTVNLEAMDGANDRSKYLCFMINRSICEDRMHYPDHRRLMRPSTWHYSYFFFRDLQIKASNIAEAPPLSTRGTRKEIDKQKYVIFFVLFINSFFFFLISR